METSTRDEYLLIFFFFFTNRVCDVIKVWVVTKVKYYMNFVLLTMI